MQDKHVMSSRPALREGICAARSSDGVIFLDVLNDCYSSIYDPLVVDEALHPMDLSAFVAAHGAEVDVTIGAGLASRGTREWQDMPDGCVPPLGINDIMRFGLALARASLAFRRCSFAQLLDRPSAWAWTAKPVDPADLVDTVRRFGRLAVWLPFRMQCLFRSVFLLEFLRTYGLRADWIFGATLFPFSAHCWLAAGEMLLGEYSSRVDRLSVLRVIPAADA